MKWSRRFFYLLAFLHLVMAEVARWLQGDRGEAGYWMSCAIVNFLIGYILFTPREPQREGESK